MTEVFTITEVEENYTKFRQGNGHLDLYENMSDEYILKLIKKAASKAQGAAFTVRMLPDWNEPNEDE